MDASTLLADPDAIRLECFVSEPHSVTLVVRAAQRRPCCPKCGVASTSLHSHYTRHVADLPWHGVTARLELHTRKLRCRNELCERKVFCERLPEVVAAYARKTVRLNAALTLLAFAMGGEAGARAACGLSLQVSPDTLLRRIRQFQPQSHAPIKVLGVDDFAFRRGQRYGTILVDLEKHQPVELLPDREAETFAAWLRQHPEVEIISRDRGGSYAAGARAGAPHAVQVADRFHLLKNLLDGFEKFLYRRHTQIKAATQAVFHSPQSLKGERAGAEKIPTPSAAQALLTAQRQAKLARREHRYRAVKELHRAGLPILTIARRLNMQRCQVREFIAAESLPQRRARSAGCSPIYRYLPYLQRRWEQGERRSRALWKEIKSHGYAGAEVTLRHFLQRWRVSSSTEIEVQTATRSLPGRAPSVRRIKWLLFSPEKRKEEWERQLADELCHRSGEIDRAQKLVRDFHRLLRERRADELQGWLGAARAGGIGELVYFANSVGQDRTAVSAAFVNEWSQGQVEGQVNRLKFIKRATYGRAKFDLLRARVIHQPAA